ncbi:hypothetical protein ACEUAM_02920 [Aeromonas hydrophila]|uniref:hypothetical protein n=1 Tax=Aeromonas TaxID=642 RepID=UPI002B4962E9|nr:hypothetical protein [Aeromonas veronii]
MAFHITPNRADNRPEKIILKHDLISLPLMLKVSAKAPLLAPIFAVQQYTQGAAMESTTKPRLRALVKIVIEASYHMV